MNCPFRVGDEVKHKTSGEQGVISEIDTECNQHTMWQHSKIAAWEAVGKEHEYGECVMEYTGQIKISFGVGVLDEGWYDGDLFERV